MTEKQLTQFERWWKGQMAPQEQAEWLRLIEQDVELKKEVDFMTQLGSALLVEKYQKSLSLSVSIVPFSKLVLPLAAILVILIAFVAITFSNFSQSPNQSYASLYTSYEERTQSKFEVNVIRTMGDEQLNLLHIQVEDLYLQGKYEEALAYLNGFENITNQDTLLYFKGLLLLKNQNPELALKSFYQLKDMPRVQPGLLEKTDWLTVLALLRLNNPSEICDKLLSTSQNRDHLFFHEVMSLLTTEELIHCLEKSIESNE